jgi:hypothetical protein
MGNRSLYNRLFILLIITLSFQKGIFAQSLPVGTAVLEDALRRAQLLGEIDSSISFVNRPLFPAQSMKLKNTFDPYSSLDRERWRKTDGVIRFANEKGKVQLLPFTWQQQFNTQYPYSLNDGAMIPARGNQTMISGGIYAEYGPISIQLKPEYVNASNKDFQGFYKEHSDNIWKEYYNLHNTIDLPERFGELIYEKIFWGQSSARITRGSLSLGLSSENLWWGPGMQNSLMMSNSAPGFHHVTLNTVKPILSFIGSFEGQIIGGKLENSGFAPPDTNRTYNGIKLYSPKRNDWRYINAMVISYQPKWVHGLFLGATRSFIIYHEDMGNTLKDYLPILTPFAKKENYGEGESSAPSDQRSSVFIRWLWTRAQAEIYGEYLREDHAYNFRDLILQLEYSHAYLWGFSKMIALNRMKKKYLQVNAEFTKIEQTITNPERPSKYIYTHTAGVRHGYTNMGQMLGAGIGPGSNLQNISISWIQELKSLGINFIRYVHNNDFHNAIIKDQRAKWTDTGIEAFGNWNWKNLLFSAKMQFINSYNYQHRYIPTKVDPETYWIPGENTFNFQAQLSTCFRF